MTEFNVQYPGHHFIRGARVTLRSKKITYTDYSVTTETMYESLYFALKAAFKLTGLNPPADIIEAGDPEVVKAYIKVVNGLMGDNGAFLFNGEAP